MQRALSMPITTIKKTMSEVGASNVEEFMLQMQDHEGSFEDFDHFIIPTVSDNKQQIDTWETVKQLNDIGVKPANISLIFNRVHRYDAIDDKFKYLINLHKQLPFCRIDQQWVIRENELFSKIQSSKLSVTELAEDPTDYKSLSRATSETDEKIALVTKLGTKRLSQGVKRSFDSLFHALELGICHE